jgi:hypothetical protein
MTASNWIAIAGIVVAAFVALAIAHMQRKQIRQIELHRADPNVPLETPLHPVTRFLKRYWFFLMAVGWMVSDVIEIRAGLRKSEPINPHDVFDMVFHMIMFGFWIISAIVFSFERVAYDLTVRVLIVIDHIADRVILLEKRENKSGSRSAP